MTASLDEHLEAILQVGIPGVVVSAPGSFEAAAGVADVTTGAPMRPA